MSPRAGCGRPVPSLKRRWTSGRAKLAGRIAGRVRFMVRILRWAGSRVGILGLGLDNRVAPNPSPTSGPLLDGPDSFDPSCLKAARTGVGLSQGPLLRPFLPSECKSPISRVLNADKEGNATHRGSSSGK